MKKKLGTIHSVKHNKKSKMEFFKKMLIISYEDSFAILKLDEGKFYESTEEKNLDFIYGITNNDIDGFFTLSEKCLKVEKKLYPFINISIFYFSIGTLTKPIYYLTI